MAFRREEFLTLGGFDPLFSPFYWEDVDLSYRARKRGRRIVQVEDARVDHDHGRTIGARFSRAEVATVYERNRLLFTWKNLTDPGLWRAHLAALPAKTLWDIVAHPAFVRGLGRAPRVLGGRARASGRAKRRPRDRREAARVASGPSSIVIRPGTPRAASGNARLDRGAEVASPVGARRGRQPDDGRRRPGHPPRRSATRRRWGAQPPATRASRPRGARSSCFWTTT